MLVLSRREQEAIVFPKLGIRIEVTRLRGKSVALGIEAPRELRVLRGELASQTAADDSAEATNEDNVSAFRDQYFGQTNASEQQTQRQREHQLRNRINTLTIALHLLKKNATRNGGVVDDGLLNDAVAELALIEEALHDSHTAPDWEGVQRKAALPLALIVDDSENENALMAGYLRHCGFRVATALDGQAALRLIEQGTPLPDVVLLDMNMPGLNGRQTIEAIRCNPRTSDLRVFAVSGEAADDCGVAIGPSGVNHWFRKPIRPDQLVQEMVQGLPSRVSVC